MRGCVCSTGRTGSYSLYLWLDQFCKPTMEPYGHWAVLFYAYAIERGVREGAVYMSDLLRILSHDRVILNHCPRQTEAPQTHINVTSQPCPDSSDLILVDHELSIFPEVIVKVYPKCRFIWLMRNAWDCVASMMAWRWYRQGDYADANDVHARNRIQAPWTKELSADEWDVLPPLGRCAWYWSWVNRRLEYFLTGMHELGWMHLRLEYWSDEVARRAAELFGYRPPKDLTLPHVHRSTRDDLRPRWTEEERALVRRFCGREMQRWYPDWPEPESRE